MVAALGVAEDELVCLVTVGGSAVAALLLRAVLRAVPLARALVPGLVFVVVTGPRINPASLPDQPGVRVVRYVPELYRYLAACDVAVVRGGSHDQGAHRAAEAVRARPAAEPPRAERARAQGDWSATAPVGAWSATRLWTRGCSPRRWRRRCWARRTTARWRRRRSRGATLLAALL